MASCRDGLCQMIECRDGSCITWLAVDDGLCVTWSGCGDGSRVTWQAVEMDYVSHGRLWR